MPFIVQLVTVFGLPLHVLLVHAVVVLVPLAAIGGLAISSMTWARLRYGSLVLVGAFGALISTYLAQQAGESFQRTFKRPTAAMQKHFAIGGNLLIWVVLLFLGIAAQLLAQWLIDRGNQRGRLTMYVGTAVTVIAAVVAVVQTVRIGHSGAYAVWGSG